MNTINNLYAGFIQNYTKSIQSNKLSDGLSLQSENEYAQITTKTTKHDKIELSQEQSNVVLDVSNEMTSEIPRQWTIMSETMESFNENLQQSLEEADRQNLSFGDRLIFLKEEGKKWVEDKRQNDTEMFVEWLKINKYHIQTGEADLVGLPSDFTMEDYYSYVKEPFSVLV